LFAIYSRSISSHGQLYNLLAFLDADEVVVEEVHIKGCLQNATQYLSPAEEVVYVVSVEPIKLTLDAANMKSCVLPVEDVEESIEAECCDVM